MTGRAAPDEDVEAAPGEVARLHISAATALPPLMMPPLAQLMTEHHLFMSARCGRRACGASRLRQGVWTVRKSQRGKVDRGSRRLAGQGWPRLGGEEGIEAESPHVDRKRGGRPRRPIRPSRPRRTSCHAAACRRICCFHVALAMLWSALGMWQPVPSAADRCSAWIRCCRRRVFIDDDALARGGGRRRCCRRPTPGPNDRLSQACYQESRTFV